jgi:homoserine acetyltransferase
MDICVPFCGSAKTSLHNQVMLEGVKSTLMAAKHTSSAGSTNGRVETKGSETRSQTFYRQKLHESAYGMDLEQFMVEFWEAWALSKDPENLLVMLHTWQAGDVSAQEPYNGDFEKAMGAIKARTLVLPSATDLYFP